MGTFYDRIFSPTATEERKIDGPLKSDSQTIAPPPGALALASLRNRIVHDAKSGSRVVIDLSTIPTLSSLEAAALLELVLAGKARGVEVRFAGLSHEVRQMFVGLDADVLEQMSGSPERL